MDKKRVSGLNPVALLLDFMVLVGLGALSCYFILPSKDSGQVYWAYYIVFIGFVLFTILCIVLSIVDFYIIKHFYKAVDPDINALDNITIKAMSPIVQAYRSTFYAGYNKTMANSDLYFGFIPCMSDINKIPLLALLKLLPGSYIGLGILGTFIGFSQGLSSIRVDSADSLLGGVQLLIGGLKNAFNTSIVGVIASLLLNFVVIHYILGSIESLTKSLCDYLDSIFYMNEVDILLSRLEDFEASIANNMSIVNEVGQVIPFSGVLSNMLEMLQVGQNNYVSMGEDIRRMGDNIASALGKQLRTSMDDAVKAIVQEEMEKLKQQLQLSITILQKITEGLQNAPNHLRDSMSHIDEFSKYLGSIKDSLGFVRDDFTKIQSTIENTANTSMRIQEEIGGVLNKASESIQKSTQANIAISTQANIQEQHIASIIQKLNTSMNEYKGIREETQSILLGFKCMKEDILKAFDTVNAKAYEYGSIIDKSLDGHFAAYTKSTNDRIQALKEELTHCINSLQLIDDSLDKLPSDIVEAATKLDSFTQRLNSITRSIESTTSRTTEAQANFGEVLANTNIGLKKSLEASVGFTQSYEEQLKQFQQLKEDFTVMFKGYSATSKDANSVLKGFKDMDSRLESIFSKINKSTQEYSDILGRSLSGYLIKFSEATGGISGQFSEAVDRLVEVLSDIRALKK